MIQSRADLLHAGLLTPASDDWRIRFVFKDGTERVIRVTPGRLTEEQAIARAAQHAKILDEAVVAKVEAERVAKSTQVAAFGTITK